MYSFKYIFKTLVCITASVIFVVKGINCTDEILISSFKATLILKFPIESVTAPLLEDVL